MPGYLSVNHHYGPLPKLGCGSSGVCPVLNGSPSVLLGLSQPPPPAGKLSWVSLTRVIQCVAWFKERAQNLKGWQLLFYSFSQNLTMQLKGTVNEIKPTLAILRTPLCVDNKPVFSKRFHQEFFVLELTKVKFQDYIFESENLLLNFWVQWNTCRSFSGLYFAISGKKTPIKK